MQENEQIRDRDSREECKDSNIPKGLLILTTIEHERDSETETERTMCVHTCPHKYACMC